MQHKSVNYSVGALAVLGIIACWMQHWQAKYTYNPLIPQSLLDVYFKPALLFTVIFALVLLLQAVSIYYKKANATAAIAGLVILVGSGLVYPFVASWLLPVP